MNTLQLPRDIEKALQLSWDDMHPLTEKYKSEIAEKLSTIMCVPKKNISCRSKSTLRYLNSVYNIKLTQGVGIRTLLINNSVLTSLRVTCYNYTLAELYLIDLACNYILSQPNFQPGQNKLHYRKEIKERVWVHFKYQNFLIARTRNCAS